MTVLIEIESSLNTRPLTYEVNGEVLTPSHLIYGRRINSLPDRVVEGNPDKISSGERYKYVTTKLLHFWKWKREYLVDLREFHRSNGRKQERRIELGNVVIVQDNNQKRGKCKLAVVERLVEGKDGVMRGAKIRLMGKGKPMRIERPVTKLFPLEISEEVDMIGFSQALPNVTPRQPSTRAAAIDARWKSSNMLDSKLSQGGGCQISS